MSFLCDITEKLHEVNLCLQGKKQIADRNYECDQEFQGKAQDFFNLSEKEWFKELKLYGRWLQGGNSSQFQVFWNSTTWFTLGISKEINTVL